MDASDLESAMANATQDEFNRSYRRFVKLGSLEPINGDGMETAASTGAESLARNGMAEPIV